jgi:hypothetical protein
MVKVAYLLSFLNSDVPDRPRSKPKAEKDHLINRHSFFLIFEEYTMRGVPEAIATPLADRQ